VRLGQWGRFEGYESHELARQCLSGLIRVILNVEFSPMGEGACEGKKYRVLGAMKGADGWILQVIPQKDGLNHPLNPQFWRKAVLFPAA